MGWDGGWGVVKYCIDVLEIVQIIVHGDQAETSSKIGYFLGGFLPDRRRIGAGSVVAGSLTDRRV